MQVFETIEAISAADFPTGSAVAIGKFDGIHRGHRAVLERVRHAAPLRSVAFTFANNPLSLLRPEKCPPELTSREQRLEAFAAEGLDACAMIEFDESVSAIPAESFVEDVLVGRLRAKLVVLGADFRFGHGGVGDAALLRTMGERLGFEVEVVDWVRGEHHEQVSSSRIRTAVLSGDIAAATRMLGRPPAVRGEVVHGDARGRDLGFPTANLGGRIEGLIPADGVYAGWAEVGGKRHVAAISVGVNLTFEPDGDPRVEAFLLDYSANIYGERIEVFFGERLRGMVRFESLEGLITQMHDDVRRTRTLCTQAMGEEW